LLENPRLVGYNNLGIGSRRKTPRPGLMQRSLDWFSPENPRPVGYINHQQQTINT
jgi:hypothetical protein